MIKTRYITRDGYQAIIVCEDESNFIGVVLVDDELHLTSWEKQMLTCITEGDSSFDLVEQIRPEPY